MWNFRARILKITSYAVEHFNLYCTRLKAMLHEAIFLATCNATMTNKKPFKLQRGCHTVATFFATCAAYNNKQDGGRILKSPASKRWPLIGPFWQNCAASCWGDVTRMQLVSQHCTFLATRNATIAVAKWGVTREFSLATCNATFIALQVARKIASCNMAFRPMGNMVTIMNKQILHVTFLVVDFISSVHSISLLLPKLGS